MRYIRNWFCYCIYFWDSLHPCIEPSSLIGRGNKGRVVRKEGLISKKMIYSSFLHKCTKEEVFPQAEVWIWILNHVGKTIGFLWQKKVPIVSLWFCRQGFLFDYTPQLVRNPSFIGYLCKRPKYINIWNLTHFPTTLINKLFINRKKVKTLIHE